MPRFADCVTDAPAIEARADDPTFLAEDPALPVIATRLRHLAHEHAMVEELAVDLVEPIWSERHCYTNP
jgi:hypothetical protein